MKLNKALSILAILGMLSLGGKALAEDVALKDAVEPSAVAPVTDESVDALPKEAPILLDPNQPVVPLVVDQPMLQADISAEDARVYLGELLDAQQKLIRQVKVLQARIERTEARSAANTNKIKETITDNKAQDATLTSLASKASLSGYAEMGWRVFENAPRSSEFLGANGDDGNLFDYRRINIRTNVQFTEKASWYAEVEFEDGGADYVGVEESAFVYAWKPWMNFRGGIMLPMLTYTNVNHDGPSRMLVDRPLVDQFVIPSTYRDLGFGIFGTMPFSEKRPIKYDLMVLNGFTDLINSGQGAGMPVSTAVGFNGLRNMRPHRTNNNNHFRDNNDNKALYGRLDFQPFQNLNVGVAGMHQKFDVQDEKDLMILSGDIRYNFKRFHLLAEYANAMFERGGGMNREGVRFSQYPSSVRGIYIESAYDITDKLKGIIGLNAVDLDGSVEGTTYKRLSAGLRYNIFKQVFLKTEYQFTLVPERFKELHPSNALLTQLTFSF